MKKLRKISIAHIVQVFLTLLFYLSLSQAYSQNLKAASGGEVTFTVRTVTQGGTYAPKHVLAIWVEDADGFVKTRKAMANQRKQYLYTWKAASNYNVIDAITGPTLTSHQTHTVSWNCTDLDGEIVPDGDYTLWVEFTEKHAQGPLYTITFTKGPDPVFIQPPDEPYFKDLELSFTPFVADFTYSDDQICQWETVTYTDLSVNATSWLWDFGEGAAPQNANTQGPHTVFYTNAGIKTVSLTINGNLTETKSNLINVKVVPIAGFEFSGSGLTINFVNLSANALAYTWDFGDGTTSNETNPSHTFSGAGTYIITLTANFDECSDIEIQELMLPMVEVGEQYMPHVTISPNPGNGLFWINSASDSDMQVRVYQANGKLIQTLELAGLQQACLNLRDQPPGIYFLSFESENGIKVFKAIIE